MLNCLNQDNWMVYLRKIKHAFQGLIESFHLLAKGDDLRAAVPISVAILRVIRISNNGI